MNLAAVNRFIGVPWSYPDNDCWQVFRRAAMAVFGIDVQAVHVPSQSDPQAAAVLFDAHSHGAQWQRVCEPTPGCAVLCRARGTGLAVHIGLYVVDDNVLHCIGAGRSTTYDQLRVLRRVFGAIEFYQYVPNYDNQ